MMEHAAGDRSVWCAGVFMWDANALGRNEDDKNGQANGHWMLLSAHQRSVSAQCPSEIRQCPFKDPSGYTMKSSANISQLAPQPKGCLADELTKYLLCSTLGNVAFT